MCLPSNCLQTEGRFIADLAVAVGGAYIKMGSMTRSERVAKYNQLIRIKEELGRLRRPRDAQLPLRYRGLDA